MKTLATAIGLFALSMTAQAGMFSDGAWEPIKLKFADLVYTEKAIIQAATINGTGVNIYILKTDTTYYRCNMDMTGSECWQLKVPEQKK